MTDKERLEIIKDKQLYMHSLSTFDISWLIEQAEQNIRRISKSFELDEFLRDYSDTADKGRNLTDVAMDVIKRQAERVQELEDRLDGSHKYTDSLRIVADEYLSENKHYREVLGNIRFIQEHRRTRVDYEILKIVNKTLEDSK